MNYDRFIDQCVGFMTTMAEQAQKSVVDYWKDELFTTMILLNTKEEKVAVLQEKIKESRDWFKLNNITPDTAVKPIDFVSTYLQKNIEVSKLDKKLREHFGTPNEFKLKFDFKPSSDWDFSKGKTTHSVDISFLYVTVFTKHPGDGFQVALELSFEFVLTLIVMFARIAEIKYLNQRLDELGRGADPQVEIKEQEVHLSPGFEFHKSDIGKKIKAELSPRSTAILFYYLRDKKATVQWSDSDLSKFIALLTGHSDQNIRADGLGSMRLIDKNPKYTEPVITLLQQIIDKLKSTSNL